VKAGGLSASKSALNGLAGGWGAQLGSETLETRH